MYPMDFGEFMLASGVDDALLSQLEDAVKKHRAIPPFWFERLSVLFRQYMIVGGMPEAVSTFFATNDYRETRRVLRRILNDYESDFGTHLNDDLAISVNDVERAIIADVFHSIPRQLAKENKKFQFKVVKPNGDRRTYGFAIDYLRDYGLVTIARNVTSIENPLDYFALDDQFKIYLCDTGLFVAMLGEDVPSLILSGEMGTGKGMIYENIFADAYSKQGRKLFYYRKPTGAEVDFVDSFNGEITLIEIKAKTGATKAASALLSDPSCNANHLIRVTAGNVGYSNSVLNIPHFLCMLLGEGFSWAC